MSWGRSLAGRVGRQASLRKARRCSKGEGPLHIDKKNERGRKVQTATIGKGKGEVRASGCLGPARTRFTLPLQTVLFRRKKKNKEQHEGLISGEIVKCHRSTKRREFEQEKMGLKSTPKNEMGPQVHRKIQLLPEGPWQKR